MIIEGLTIAGIIGSCGLLAWYAKNKFQPEIEKAIEEQKKPIEAPNKPIEAPNKPENKLYAKISKIRK